MLKEDMDKLKDLVMNYSPNEFMKVLKTVVQDVADENSDNGLKERAKDFSRLAQTLDDITSGRPFLV